MPRNIALNVGIYHIHGPREMIRGVREFSEGARTSPWLIRSLSPRDMRGEEPPPPASPARWLPEGLIVYQQSYRGLVDMLWGPGLDSSPVPIVSIRPSPSVAAQPADRPGDLLIVDMDERQIGRRAADHLLSCGLERFHCLGPVDVRHCRLRIEGFASVLREADRSFELRDVSLDKALGIYRHVRLEPDADLATWLADLPKPAGVFALGDALGREVLDACVALDIRVPEDLAVLGVGDTPEICLSSHPLMTSVPVPWARMGATAARCMDGLLGDERPPAPMPLAIPPVERRQSTDIAAQQDPMLAQAIAHIRDHACDPIDVAGLLRAVPIGRRRLERGLRRVLGRTPHQEIRRVQMDRARSLLVRSDLTVEEVAQRVGLTRAHFAKVFGESVGCSPHAYRKRYRFPATGR